MLTSVSYTHLDVYKRQLVHLAIDPALHQFDLASLLALVSTLLCHLFHTYISLFVIPLNQAIMLSSVLVFPTGVLSVSLLLSHLVLSQPLLLPMCVLLYVVPVFVVVALGKLP